MRNGWVGLTDENPVFDLWGFEVWCERPLLEVALSMLLLTGEP
jgi:hypothetical protein